MKTITRTEIYPASPEIVFQCLDDAGISGMHMTKSSGMMMGSKLNLEFLTEQHSGPGTKYRWSGTMLGITMDFTVEVTKWVKSTEKSWETIGEAKMIIYSWYRMHLMVQSTTGGTVAELSISYTRPTGFLQRILSFFFADWYCRWCLKKMLGDTKQILQNREIMEHSTN